MFLGLIRVGRAFSTACKAVNMTRRAVGAYLEAHPLRAAEFLDAERAAVDAIEEVVYEQARAGDFSSQKFWLERRDRERWAPAASSEGPAKIVLDPAALKGMLGTGSALNEDASEVEDDRVLVADPPSEVVTGDIT